MAEKKYYDQVKNSLDESTFMVSDDNFKLPDMGDYYNTAVDNPYIKMVDEAIREVTVGDTAKASFYIEQPYTTQLGSHDLEGIYFIKATPDYSDYAVLTGKNDGDTLYFEKDTMVADTETLARIKNSYENALETLEAAVSFSNGKKYNFTEMGVRFLGLNTPETPKYSLEFLKLSKEETTSLPISELKNRSKDLYFYEKGKNRTDNNIVKLIKVDGIWKEYTEAAKTPEEESKMKGFDKIQILHKEGEEDPEKLAAGLKAKKIVQELVEKAGGDVYFMIDRTSLNRSSEKYPGIFGVNAFSGGIGKLKYWFQQIIDYNPYKYAGYNLWGQDQYGRYLGTPYVKITNSTGTQWINIAKYVIANVPETVVLPDYTGSPLLEDNYGQASKVFKLHTYDYKNRLVADAIDLLADKLDDRRTIQREIFGRDFDALKEWTVSIGDVTLFVPPTSIRSIVNTTHERVPTVRSKGSITKGALKEERMLEMTIYFNDDRGVNGYEYKTKLPDGKEVTYHMNGLRALISQFKFTPFLPIDNEYINEMLNVDAVTLVNLQISTLPDYPKCIAAVLTLQEFDYTQYMPELPADLDENDNYRNVFASTINYEVMRWYYQRALLLGQELKDVDVNSQTYLEKTYGSRTALVPMKFDNPNIRFLIANEEHLKKMLQVKMDMIRRTNTKIVLSDTEKEVAKDISRIYNSLGRLISSEKYKAKLDDLLSVEEHQNISVKKTEKEITGTNKLSKTGLGLYQARHPLYAPVENGSITDRVNDFLNYIRTEIMKANDEAERTIISSATLVYREKKIEEVKFKPYEDYLNIEAGKYDENGKYIDNPDEWETVKEKYVQGTVILGVELSVQLDYLTNPKSQIADLMRDASLITQVVMDGVFENKKIFIPFNGTFERDENNMLMPYVMNKDAYKFKLDVMNPNIQFLAYCRSIARELGMNDDETINEEALNLKQSSDMDSMENLVYEEYGLGDVRIKNLSAGFGNVFTRTSLNGSSGYAPQYMGGQDTVIEVSLETTDPYSVGLISALPRIATQYARDYRLVMPASPLKLDSEITKLLGVNEVVIENVNIETVPNQPGLYQISMRLVSMDRTLRNREGLRKINEFVVSGKNGSEEQAEMQLQTYFELSKALAAAEVYPDLELPKLEELEDHNFVFIRHKFEENRVYPDPDFYFVYGHVLQSQIFREAIENAASDASIEEMVWKDKFGGEVSTKTSKKYGVEVTNANDKAKEQGRAVENVDKLGLAAKEEGDLHKSNWDIINVLRAADITSSWNVSDNIKVMFLEPAYLSLLNNYSQIAEAPSEKEKLSTSSGVWVHEAMEPARKASKKIEKFLAKKISTSNEVSLERIGFGDRMTFSETSPHDKTNMDNKINSLITDSQIQEIFDLLQIKADKKFMKSIKNIMWSAACAATSEKEFTGKKGEGAWKPNMNFVGMRVANTQDDSDVRVATTIEEAVKYGIEFGPFRIKMHTKEEIKKITNTVIPSNIFKSEKGDSINKQYYLLDPYYRNGSVTLKEIEEYKTYCVKSLSYATEAFFRLMLFWLKRMIDDNILPNMSLDVLKGEFENEIQKTVQGASRGDLTSDLGKELSKYMVFLEKSDRAIDAGKMFASAVMALTNSNTFYQPMTNRRYDMLNGLVDSALSNTGNFNPHDMESIMMRKMLLALVGLGEIKKETDIGKQSENPITDFKKSLNEKKYIEAAEDPTQYVRHSFYDMVANDRRGRMCRAFPTFYVVFVDEGREIGLWKLHDNFYNINAISEIQVAKSRKNPADTCRIVLSNLFHTLTSDDEDSNMTYEYDYKDVFTSIFNPRSYYMKEEAKRMKQQPLNRAKLTAGTRIHVRMGFGANAASLPVAFNGMIAEVGMGEMVEIVAQGDGVELLNPILDSTEAHKKQHQDQNPASRIISNLFTSAATPKNIIDSFLTVEGGFVEKKVREWTNGYYFNDHPLGITHFGNPRYDVVLKAGEPTQNIFEAINKPAWADLSTTGITKEWSLDEAPKFTIDVFGKTFWDILNICGSASPDYIVGIAPFGFRSTIFHGHPRFYYAYEYYKDTDGTVLERRKPYQQYHIYTSFSDIIKNDVKASSQELKTNAMGLYRLKGWGTKESQEKVGPLWVDWDIYPEYQKSMVYDTQLLAKGVPVLGTIIPFLNTLIDKLSDKEGAVQSGKAVAWRMTANALKESVHDMYQGELIVTGDPSVKPHDRFYLYDIYEDMSGSALVEGVVHNFSAENGYTTTIYPDCIAVIDDRYEIAVQTIAGNILSKSLMAYIATLAPSMIWGRSLTPLIAMSGKTSRRVLTGAAKVAKGVGAQKTAKKIVKTAQATKKLYTAGKLAAAGGAVVASGGTALIPLLAVGIEMGIVHTMTSLAYNSIERWMGSKQVLQIYPLRKHQKVLTSGLDGSKGLVYGSPTYEMNGMMEGLFSKLDTENNGFSKGVNFVIDMLATDEMKAIASKYSTGKNASINDPSAISEENATQRMLSALAANQSRNQSGYHRLLLTPRMNPQDEAYGEKLIDTYSNMAFLDTNGIEIQTRIANEMIYVKNDPKMKEAMEKGMLQLAWDSNLPENTYESREFNLSGERTAIRAIAVERNNKTMYDIPFLHPDAITVLREIIIKCSYLLPEEEPEKEKSTPEDFVMLHSALKVGDSETFSSLGLSFILEAMGERKKTLLLDAIKAIQNEIDELYKNGELITKKLFEWSTDTNNNGEETLLLVTVYPPSA